MNIKGFRNWIKESKKYDSDKNKINSSEKKFNNNYDTKYLADFERPLLTKNIDV